MKSIGPEDILCRMSYPNLEGPYALGCFGTMVSFYSQQLRAFNLVWALFETGRLKAGERLAVVGGGLAGLTAAAAAASKGCMVTLFERNEDLLHVQRTNGSRYIHPHVNRWPATSVKDTTTDLPFLNWYASRTSDVCAQIEEEWRSFDAGLTKNDEDVTVRRRHDVTDVQEVHDGYIVVWQNGAGGEAFSDGVFRRVILAVGFGLERSMAPIPFRSYWEDDSLHQGVTVPGRELKIVVSGTGDGGLIDTLRVCLRDFDHNKFLRSLALRPELDALRDELLRIEAKSRDIEADGSSLTDAGVYQFAEYRKLNFGHELVPWLESQLRPRVEVTLRGRGLNPFGLGSALIHRIALFLLIRIGKVHYLRGEISAAHVGDGRWKVTIDGGTATHRTLECDHVVVRHGPDPIIGNFLAKTAVDKLKVLAKTDDVAVERRWPPKFYQDRPSRWLVAQIRSSGSPVPPFLDYRLTRALLGIAKQGQETSMVRASIRLHQMAQTGDARAADAIQSCETKDVIKALTDGSLDVYLDAINGAATLAYYRADFLLAKSLAERVLINDTDNREALSLLGHIFRRQREFDLAEQQHQLLRKLAEGDPVWTARALNNLALIALERAQTAPAGGERTEFLTEAEDLLEQSLAIAKENNDHLHVATATSNLADVYRLRGEVDRAIEIYQATLQLERELGRPAGITADLQNLGLAHLEKAGRMPPGPGRDDHIARSREHLNEALKRAVDNRDRKFEADLLENLGQVEALAGRAPAARDHWQNALALFREMGLNARRDDVDARIRQLT